MSDNDCVSRKAVLALLNATSQEEITDECYDRLYDAVANMDAVPHEMTAREFVSAFQQMCYKEYIDGCSACPLWQTTPKYDCMLRENDPKTIVAIVEKWAREHPEERSEDNGNSQLDR